ncbi:MAG: anti-sigma factor antagonist [Solirubrobacteraceae bacterium]|jgi:anti-anti-sigma factor|nr:anti-sigma factor antagonist [Solirubrobacteraceae bacterium]
MASNSRHDAERRGDPVALRIRSFRDREAHVIELAGDLDLASAGALERELRRAELSEAKVIAVDLRQLTFIESTGIRLIFQAHRRSSRGSSRMVVVRGTESVQRRFEICDIRHTLPFVDRLPSDSSPATRSATSRRVSQAALASAVRELRTHPRLATLR